MRFLVDAALSPLLAVGLRDAGHESVHVGEYEMLQSSDAEILARAREEDRVVVSADTDFATLLAMSHATSPSLVLFRHPMRDPRGQVTQLVNLLDAVADSLEEGSVVVIEESRLRIRRLPIGESTEN